MFFSRKSPLRVICVGSSSKDVFFPISGIDVVDTPNDLTAQKKIQLELGGKYKSDDRYEAVGGVAANVSQGMALLDVETAIYTNVGADDIGEWIRRELSSRGVDTRLITVDPEVMSDLSAIIVLAETGERTIIHNRDANERIEVDPDKISGAEWLFISSLNGAWEDRLRMLLDTAKRQTMRVAFNPGQHNLRDNPSLIFEAAAASELLLLNKDEAIELVLRTSELSESDRSKTNDERFLFEQLHRLGGRVIGMTDGIRGAWASDGKRLLHCKPLLVEGQRTVDTTGAGDAFTSAFLAAWIRYGDIERSVRWGIANGTNVTKYYGANAGLLKRADIEAIESQLIVESL